MLEALMICSEPAISRWSSSTIAKSRRCVCLVAQARTAFVPVQLYLLTWARILQGVMLDVTTPQGSRLGQLYLDLQFQPTASSDAGSHRPQNKRSGGLKSCCGSRPGSHNSSRQAEVTYVEPVRKDPFFDTVHKTVGEMYEIVGKGMGDKNALYKEWGEMRLIILARREVLPFISGTEVATEATGLGGVYHNKGGIVAKLELQGISVCFACSHLAAHEGVKHCEDRNRHAAEIQEAA